MDEQHYQCEYSRAGVLRELDYERIMSCDEIEKFVYDLFRDMNFTREQVIEEVKKKFPFLNAGEEVNSII